MLCVLKRADRDSTGSGADSSICTTARTRRCTAMDGLEADEMQDVIKARVVAHIVEPRACPIQTQYVFRPRDTLG